MPLPAAAQITIFLTMGGSVWMRAASKDMQHTVSDHHDLLITKNRTVAAERLRYAGKDFTVDNPATYFSTDELEAQTRNRLRSIGECLHANRRSRLLLRTIRVLSPLMILLGICSIVSALFLGFKAASGMPDDQLSALFLRILVILGPLTIVGAALLEACNILHGREYENSRARTSVS